MGEKLRVVSVTFREACDFVKEHHRHHKPPRGHKFSVGVALGEILVGVAIVGRPVARAYDDGSTLEVVRTATDGTPNANSVLYGACRRVTFGLGHDRLITYTQEGETGSSLKGAGWQVLAKRKPRAGWSTPARPRENKNDYVERTLWEVNNDG